MEFIEESRWGRMTNQPGVTAGEGELRSVFRYHRIDERKVARYALQVGKNAAGDKDRRDSTRTRFRNGGLYRWIEHSIARDGAIVIQCQNTEFQRSSLVWLKFTPSSQRESETVAVPGPAKPCRAGARS